MTWFNSITETKHKHGHLPFYEVMVLSVLRNNTPNGCQNICPLNWLIYKQVNVWLSALEDSFQVGIVYATKSFKLSQN